MITFILCARAVNPGWEVLVWDTHRRGGSGGATYDVPRSVNVLFSCPTFCTSYDNCDITNQRPTTQVLVMVGLNLENRPFRSNKPALVHLNPRFPNTNLQTYNRPSRAPQTDFWHLVLIFYQVREISEKRGPPAPHATFSTRGIVNDARTSINPPGRAGNAETPS